MDWVIPSDGCGVCVSAGSSAAVRPMWTVTEGDMVAAAYRCPVCGRMWKTCWAVRVLAAAADAAAA